MLPAMSDETPETIRTLAGLGVDTFVEFGPGTVLTGLVKRILPDARTVNVGTAEQIEQFQMENA